MTIIEAIRLALQHYQSGNLKQAEYFCKIVLDEQPDNAEMLYFLGIISAKSEDYDLSIKYIERSLEFNKENAEAYLALGIVYQKKGLINEAINAFQKSDSIHPGNAFIYNNLGHAFREKGLVDEAVESYQKALQMNPSNAGLYNNLGSILHEKGQLDEAFKCYKKALKLNPEFAGIYSNLGNILQDKGQTDEAILFFRKALELNPYLVESYINLGNSLQSNGLIDEALACLQKAVQLCPESAYTHYNLSLIYLLTGNFREGWRQYEWRKGIEDLQYLRTKFPQPIWDGSDIVGKPLLILGEQGFGDVIQFIRYMPLVAKRKAELIVVCHKELSSLLKNMKDISQVLTYGEKLPYFDIYCHLLSLPYIFDTSIESIPADVPYISVDAAIIQKWRNRLQHDNSGLKIGLVWAGNPGYKQSRYRNCFLDNFFPLAKFENVSFYSLQKGGESSQANNLPKNMKFYDYTEEINDFSDTAAFIYNLDLVISVDTAVAHLTGALGKPVWTLIPYAPDWRWMLNRTDSPWYPTMRLFRQPSTGDWRSVISDVEDALKDLLKSI